MNKNKEAITKLHVLREMLIDKGVEIESFDFKSIVSAINFLESDIPVESWIELKLN